MFELPFQPVLALDMQDIISGLFFIIMFLGWIFQAMASKNEDKKKPGARRQRKGEKQKVDNEISQFFQEINDLNKPKPVPPKQQPAIINDFDIELVDLDDEPADVPVRQHQPSQRSRSSRNRPARKKQQQQVQQSRGSSRQTIESRKLPDSSLGEGLVQHTEDYIDGNSDVKQAHFDSLGSGVVQSVSSHMGSVSQKSGTQQQDYKSDNLRQLLSNPQNIRQAILLNEVLSKPISLR